MTGAAEVLDAYVACVEAVDLRGAKDLVLELFDEGQPLTSIVLDVLAPTQVRVGQLWQDGAWSVADEHAATMVTEGVLSALTHAAGTRRGEEPRHLVVACPEGEWHHLAARMAAAVASTGGDRVTLLGPSLSADQLRRRLSAGDVDLVALSCTLPTNLVGAARCVAAAHDLQVPVLAGGSAFGASPRRAHAVGADAWAGDARALLLPTPALAGRSSTVPVEALLLDGADPELVALALDRSVSALRCLSALSTSGQERARQELVQLARVTGAALLTGDQLLVEQHLEWLCSLYRLQVLPPVVTDAAQILADSLDPVAPSGAALLRAAADVVAARQPGTGEVASGRVDA